MQRVDRRLATYQGDARAGDIDAMYNLAVSLEARQMWAGARLWYGRAAAAGDVDAMFNLAVLFDRLGQPAEATRWFRRAASAGDHEARLTFDPPLESIRHAYRDPVLDTAPVADAADDAVDARPGLTRVSLSPSTRRWRWLVGSIVLVAGIWPIVGSIWLFPSLTRNADEVVWLAQAEVLESGSLTAPAPAKHPESYRPWFASMRDGRYVYRYAPLFPAVLAASDLVTGTPRTGLGLVSAWAILAVYLLVAELVRRRGTALLAAVLVGTSPLFFLTSAMFLGYVFFIGAFCTAAWLLVRGARTDRSADLVLAGAAFGLAIFHRPYDALWLGVPWLAWFAWRSRRKTPKAILLVAVGALPVFVAMLIYNWHLTGDALKPPFLLWDPRDTVGFGLHSLSPTDPQVEFTFSMGLTGVGHFWEDLLLWTVPGLPLLAGASLLVLRTAGRRLAPLAGMLPALTFGWIGFWGSYYAQFRNQLGPMYFLPLVVPLAALTAVGATALVQAIRRPAHRALAYAVGGCLLAAALVEGGAHAAAWQPKARTAARVVWQLPSPASLSRAVGGTGRTRAIIFLPEAFVGFLPPLHNTPQLDGTRLYVADRPGTNDLAIVAAHPDRAVFRLVAALDGSVRLQRLR
ncbi:MAG TPA: glycosyltransferase family 39 protein [Acidimicrobiales bacterium]|nr:glycosyltransferase family 39 protein [Acidimicrobiales bacterium]